MKRLRKWFYKFFKSKYAYGFFIGLFLALIILISYLTDREQFDFAKFFRFDMVLSISVTGIVGFLIALTVRVTGRSLEDSIKLEEKFDRLCAIYTQENFIKHDNGKKVITVPVSYLAALPADVEIVYKLTDEEYSLPFVCKQNFQTLFAAHKYSEVRNREVVRLCDYALQGKRLELIIQKTNFFNGLVTNRACDLDIDNGLTIRGIFEYKSRFTPLKKSQLSNHLGINGFVFTADDKLLFIKRDAKKSIAKRKWGNSFGHPLAAEEMSAVDSDYTINQTYETICARYSIPKGFISHCRPVAVIRTATEAGKPSLVYNVYLNVTAAEFWKHIKEIPNKKFVKQYCKRIKTFGADEVEIKDADVFFINGKEYPSTIDCVAEYLICTGKTDNTIISQ